jgi:hypothetical protein
MAGSFVVMSDNNPSAGDVNLKSESVRLGSGMDKIKNPHAKALGALGGSVGSAAQKRAARLNGKKGGRPKGSKDKAPRKPRKK